MLPFLQRAQVQACRNGIEQFIINGDTTATHMDNDINAITRHPAKNFIGLRKAAKLIDAASGPFNVDAGGNKIDTSANWRSYMMLAKGRMGRWGIKSGVIGNRVGIVSSAQGYNQFLSVEDFSTAASLSGGSGTNVQGAFGFTPYGMVLMPSEIMKENLASTGVNTAGGPNTFTGHILVSSAAWILANLRNVTIEVLRERYAEEDQVVVLVKWRGAFGTPYGTSGTEKHTNYVFDVAV